MVKKYAVGRGRPQAASKAVLEEAAQELFLENGYDSTNVSAIATRAGVSRATFFNYFDSKADIFWDSVDSLIADVPAILASLRSEDAIRQNLADFLLRLATGVKGSDVPWVLTQYETIGSPPDIDAAALERLQTIRRHLTLFVAEKLVRVASDRTVLWHVNQTVALLLTALETWVRSGSDRGDLLDHVNEVLALT